MYSSLIIIDDFLADPDEIRQAALALEYKKPNEQKNYPGRNSTQRLNYPGLDEIVSELTGEKVVGSAERNAHGHCRVSLAGDDEARKYFVHVDLDRDVRRERVAVVQHKHGHRAVRLRLGPDLVARKRGVLTAQPPRRAARKLRLEVVRTVLCLQQRSASDDSMVTDLCCTH